MQQQAIMPIRETLNELAKTASVLNSETNELNEIIGDFEQALQDAGVGLTVWLEGTLLESSELERNYRSHDVDERWPIDTQRGWELGFAKVDGDWRVAVHYIRRESTADDSNTFEERAPIALAKAPRIVRVEAAPLLEDLAKEITERMRRYIAGIEKAKANARDDDAKADKRLLARLRREADEAWRNGDNWYVDVKGLSELSGLDYERAEAALGRFRESGALVQILSDFWTFPDVADRLRR